MSQTQNMIFAGKIADTFIFKNQPGVIVVASEAWAVAIRVHDYLSLIKPDGETLLTRVGGIEMTNPPTFDGKCGLLLLANNLSEDDVEIGSTLWLVRY